MSLMHHAKLDLPEREGKHYVGTNRGNAITGVKVPCDEDLWVTTVAEKLDIFGTSDRTVHGKLNGKRELEDYEPLMFHCWPREIYEEYIHLFLVATVIDMSPGSGTFAEACLRSSTGYAAICWSAQHQRRMEQRLKLFLLKEMMDETSPLYNPMIRKHIECDNVDSNVGSDSCHVDGNAGSGPAGVTSTKKLVTKMKAAKAAATKHKKDAIAKLSMLNGGDVVPPVKKMKLASATDNVKEDNVREWDKKAD